LDDFSTYLSELLQQKSTRDAQELLGYGRNSFSSLSALCQVYGVEIPERKNQHAHSAVQEQVKPKPVRLTPATRKSIGVERCVVICDTHVPYQDNRAVAVALALIEDLKPERVVLAGDMLDMYAVSRFSKEPLGALGLQDELDQTKDLLREIRRASGKARLEYVEGNHEARLTAYLHTRAPELAGLTALSITELLDLDSLDITYIKSRGRSAFTTFGAVAVGHFDKCSKHSGYTAKALVDDRCESLVQGHVHRLGTHYKTLPNGDVLLGVESGCLCDLSPEYVANPNWQHGLTVITKRTDTDRFHLAQVPIVDYEAIYKDVLYSA